MPSKVVEPIFASSGKFVNLIASINIFYLYLALFDVTVTHFHFKPGSLFNKRFTAKCFCTMGAVVKYPFITRLKDS